MITAAHAGYFAMKLAFTFESAGYKADEINATCVITFEGGALTSSLVNVKVKISEIQSTELQQLIADSGKNCPVSKVLNTTTTVSEVLI